NTDSVVGVEAGSRLSLNGDISGPGGLTKVGPGELDLVSSIANTYGGLTRVNAGTLGLFTVGIAVPGDLVIGDGLGGPNADVVLAGRIEVIADTAAVTVNSSGLLSIVTTETIGSLAGTGNVALVGFSGAPGGLSTGANNLSAAFSGVIS